MADKRCSRETAIMQATMLLCEMIIRRTEHETPGEMHDMAELLLKGIKEYLDGK